VLSPDAHGGHGPRLRSVVLAVVFFYHPWHSGARGDREEF